MMGWKFEVEAVQKISGREMIVGHLIDPSQVLEVGDRFRSSSEVGEILGLELVNYESKRVPKSQVIAFVTNINSIQENEILTQIHDSTTSGA